MPASSTVAYWSKVCLAHMSNSGRMKLAELGGDGQDTSFEQAFSNLAHAYLSDKAPTLLDHELGFQLIDRNNENTKAVGVFAFKVGSQQLYAPVFFLKGQLKGHELLYLRNQDRFVPLKENWLNSILNKKPNILGAGVQRQTSQLGVRQPDLNRLARSPGKIASEIMPLIGHLATANLGHAVRDYAKHCQEKLNLTHFIKQAAMPTMKVMVDTMQRFPRIAQAFDEWHGIETLHDAIKEASARMDTQSLLDDPYVAVNRNRYLMQYGGSIFTEKLAADEDNGPDYNQKIKVITPDTAQVTGDVPELDETDREKLLTDNLLIKDWRTDKEVSVPVNLQVEQRMFNPGETGIYQVYTKDNKLEECLVVVGPHGAGNAKNISVVVRMDSDKRNWANYEPGAVFAAAREEEKLGDEAWTDWFDKLPDATTLSDDGAQNYYILIGPNRTATCPFHVMERYEDDTDGSVSANVYISDRCLTRDGRYRYDGNYDSSSENARVHLNMKNGTKLRSHDGDLYVPKGFKLFKLNPTREEKEPKDAPAMVSCTPYGVSSATPPIVPGTLRDALQYGMDKTAALKIATAGHQYALNDSQLLGLNDAVVCLVTKYGLREQSSRNLLKKADAKRHSNKSFECRLKLASPFLTHGGPNAPGYDESGRYGGENPLGFAGETQTPYEQEQVVGDLSAMNTDPNVYNVNPNNLPEPMDANGVMSAINSGQKEVFDTSMIGSMLKAVRDDTMIDRYLPDLVTSVDRLGRLLFMFYWHGDKFADRYGKQDMPELEDSLRNSFEMNGDVVLFLKQKTIEPYPEQDIKDIDLGRSAVN